jgi:trigger factor
MGMTVEDYMKQVKKTEEDMRKEWRPDAEKRGKLQLVWSAIADKEKIAASPEAIEEEVKHILEHHTDADPARARAYITMMLNNEKVFEFLESQK